jgi:hypothetical protein
MFHGSQGFDQSNYKISALSEASDSFDGWQKGPFCNRLRGQSHPLSHYSVEARPIYPPNHSDYSFTSLHSVHFTFLDSSLMLASKKQQPNLYKEDDESYFKLQVLQNWRMFERGFLQFWNSVPERTNELSIPPAEYYDHIAMSFQRKDAENLIVAKNNFVLYLFNNGFDDRDEIECANTIGILCDMCQIPLSENSLLASVAFHILSLLQTKGPAFPYYLHSNEFIIWCFGVFQRGSAIMYYPLTCLMNHCALGEP